MFDSHCHLADAAFAGDLPAVVGRAVDAGVEAALCILSADEPDELARAGVVRDAWPAVKFAAGIHPHRAAPYAGRAADAAAVATSAAQAQDAVAIGEIGLDYHYDFAPKDVQHDVFRAQLAAAAALGLPVVIHTREAAEDTFAILAEVATEVTAIMHCFTGRRDEARRALDLGAVISIAGIVTFPKGGALRDLAAYVPADRLLVETDAPFLAPVPFRGRRNEPAFIRETVGAVASARGVSVADLDTTLAANWRRLFAPAAALVPSPPPSR